MMSLGRLRLPSWVELQMRVVHQTNETVKLIIVREIRRAFIVEMSSQMLGIVTTISNLACGQSFAIP